MQPICDDFFHEVTSPAGPSSAHLNPFIRRYLDAVREYLLKLHDEGCASRAVNEEHSDLIDRLIRKLFRVVEDRYFDSFPRLNFRFAVVAVGGYGRRELSLGSDLDLLFLFRGKVNPYVETMTEAMSTRLWDAGLAVAPSTRTVRDCMRVGKEDLSTRTSYLDGRFLIGDPGLYAELTGEVRRWLKGNHSDFIEAKLAEQRQRHEEMGESLFLLQPNLRESVGGLRDYHTALWTARALRWEVRRPEHLLLHGFIDSQELDKLMGALDFIWRLRNELHRSGRKDDRLHFEAQEALAEHFGLEMRDDRLPVEQIMQSYYLHARTVQRVSARAIDHALSLDAQRRGRRPSAPRSIEEGFAILGGHLEIPSAQLIDERPVRLFAAIAAGQSHDAELSTRAQRLLQQRGALLIDDDFREDAEAADLFRRILSAPRRVYRSLMLMDELGLLGAYLPEFANLVALWQHDMYHTYTADVHSLFLVEQLRRLVRGRFSDELPLATELMREVPAPAVLYLSCILHDIGKGQGGGHSEKGSKMIPEIGKRIGLDAAEIETVSFLVRHHLTMSQMAEQRDVHDPRQILKLAKLVGSRRHLRDLYLLTVADIRSVSPEAWTEWKAGLLEALYRNTAEWFEAGADTKEAPRYFLERAMLEADSKQKAIIERLAPAGISEDDVVSFLDGMPRRYLMMHGPDELASHVRVAIGFMRSDQEIGVFPFSAQAGQEIFWGLVVLGRDRRGLLSSVAGVLSSFGHNILAAQAYTNRSGLAVEIYQVGPIPGGKAEEEAERQRIEERLCAVLRGDVSVHALLQGRPASQPRTLRSVAPSVRVTNEESDFYTVIDVTARDRVALLYDITRTLSTAGLDVVMSRVSTRANLVTDTFYVKENDHKLPSRDRQLEVAAALLEALGPGAK